MTAKHSAKRRLIIETATELFSLADMPPPGCRTSPGPSTCSTMHFDGLVKYDLETGSEERYAFGAGRFGSEAPFAPRPGATEEDDGYLLSFVYDAATDRSELLILDAADPSAGPIGRVLLPVRVPNGFHSCWVPAEDLDRARRTVA